MKTLFNNRIFTITLKKGLKLAIFMAICAVSFGLSTQVAHAASPVLTLTNAGGNQVRIEVTGDVNSSVQLYYYSQYNSGSIVSAGIIGSTNSSGYFTITVSQNTYGVPAGSSVFVNVNNQQSANVVWPTVTGGNVYLSQNNIYLNVGQSQTVGVSGGTGTYYISQNSNSNAVTATISGSAINLYGVNAGSSNLTICSAASGVSCANLYVNVGGYNGYNGSNQYVTLSQTNINVQSGQNQSVNISGSGSYYISGNSNSGIASATINGSMVNIYGISNGSTSFTICSQTNTSYCSTLYVTVYSSYNNGYNNGYNNNYSGYYCNGTYYTYYNPCGGNNYQYPYNNYQQPIVYSQPTVTYTQPTIVRSDYGRPVTGVYLSQIPATGISYGLKVMLFVLGLIIWSSAIAYFMISRRTKLSLSGVSTKAGNSFANLTKAEQFKQKQLQRLYRK